MNEQDKEAILNFAEAYAKFQATQRGKFPECDTHLYGEWKCCLYHELKDIEYDAIKQMAEIIDKKYPSIRNGNDLIGICSYSWFEGLQRVSGIQLPTHLTKFPH